MASKAIVRHKLTKKQTQIEVSDNFADAEGVKTHLAAVIPDHEVVSVEMGGDPAPKETPPATDSAAE